MPSYRVELHSHCQGDPVDTYIPHTIYQHIDRAKEVGLDAIAVTWHRKICDDRDAIAYARDRGLLLISGMEAEVNRKHLVVLNLAAADLNPEPSWDEVRALRARKPEIFIIAPHPFYPHPTCLGNEMNGHPDCIDAVEWCKLHVHWLPDRISPNLRAVRWAHRHAKPMIACTDAHTLDVIGKNASLIDAEELTPAALFTAIRTGRVYHRHSLALAPLVYEIGKAITSQHRHIGRWVRSKFPRRKSPALPKNELGKTSLSNPSS